MLKGLSLQNNIHFINFIHSTDLPNIIKYLERQYITLKDGIETLNNTIRDFGECLNII